MLNWSSRRIKRTTFQSLAERLVQKVSNILHQSNFQAAPPTCPLHVWKGSRGQSRVTILKVMLHTFRKTITDYCTATGMFSPSQEKFKLVEEAKKYHIDIVGSFFYQKTWFWNHRFGWQVEAFLLRC